MNEVESIPQRTKKTLLQKYEIPLDQLSFKFVRECKDVKLLERIVRILKSGEEGYYPDLTNTAEEQLRKIHPNSRILRVETPVLKKGMIDSKQWDQISNELIEWSDDIKDQDLKLQNNRINKNITENKYQQGIRKFEMKETLKNEENKLTKMKKFVPRSYADWDKYNPEVDLLKMDVEEDKIKEEKKRKQKEKIQLLNDNLNEEIKREKKAIEEAEYTEEEKFQLSLKEKQKGNDYHINGEYKDAIKHYTKSLMLHPSLTVYNNRAISYIKLNQYTDALNDANVVLKKEPNNIKALYRRGQAYQNLKYFQKAYNDFAKIKQLDPSNKEVQNLTKQIESRCYNKIVRRMKIEEEDSSEAHQKGFVIPEPENNIRLNEWGLATSMCSCITQPDWVNDLYVNKYVSSDLCEDSNRKKLPIKTNDNSNQPLKDMPSLDNEVQISAPVRKENKPSIISTPKQLPTPIKTEKIKIPQKMTSFEFTKLWQNIKNDNTYEQHYQLLKSINPDKLNDLIGSSLDSEMLSIIFHCIDKFFLKNINNSQLNIVLSILLNLIKLPRFDINFIFMRNHQVSKNIFLKLSKENITIPMELKKAFEIDS